MRSRRPGAVIVGGLILAAWLGVGGISETVASWTDPEAGRGTFTALTVPPPVIQSCVLTPGTAGLSPSIAVKWNFASGTAYTAPPNVAYAVAKGALLSNLVGVALGSGLTTSGPVAGTYTTTFNDTVLTGLLGGSYAIYLQTVDGTGWTSTRASATASMGVAGSNPQCSPDPIVP